MQRIRRAVAQLFLHRVAEADRRAKRHAVGDAQAPRAVALRRRDRHAARHAAARQQRRKRIELVARLAAQRHAAADEPPRQLVRRAARAKERRTKFAHKRHRRRAQQRQRQARARRQRDKRACQRTAEHDAPRAALERRDAHSAGAEHERHVSQHHRLVKLERHVERRRAAAIAEQARERERTRTLVLARRHREAERVATHQLEAGLVDAAHVERRVDCRGGDARLADCELLRLDPAARRRQHAVVVRQHERAAVLERQLDARLARATLASRARRCLQRHATHATGAALERARRHQRHTALAAGEHRADELVDAARRAVGQQHRSAGRNAQIRRRRDAEQQHDVGVRTHRRHGCRLVLERLELALETRRRSSPRAAAA
jgi:hypothetical protein